MAFYPSTAEIGVWSPFEAEIGFATGGDPTLTALTRAIIARESAWNPGALRWEPQLNDGSYGLMQVLHATAKMYQPEVTPGELFIPAVNIGIGVRHLQMLLGRYSLNDAIAAYNAGSPRRGADGLYINQGYVNDVLTYYTFYLNRQEATVLPGIEGNESLPESTPIFSGESLTWLQDQLKGNVLWLVLAAGAALLMTGFSRR